MRIYPGSEELGAGLLLVAERMADGRAENGHTHSRTDTHSASQVSCGWRSRRARVKARVHDQRSADRAANRRSDPHPPAIMTFARRYFIAFCQCAIILALAVATTHCAAERVSRHPEEHHSPSSRDALLRVRPDWSPRPAASSRALTADDASSDPSSSAYDPRRVLLTFATGDAGLNVSSSSSSIVSDLASLLDVDAAYVLFVRDDAPPANTVTVDIFSTAYEEPQTAAREWSIQRQQLQPPPPPPPHHRRGLVVSTSDPSSPAAQVIQLNLWRTNSTSVLWDSSLHPYMSRLNASVAVSIVASPSSHGPGGPDVGLIVMIAVLAGIGALLLFAAVLLAYTLRKHHAKNRSGDTSDASGARNPRQFITQVELDPRDLPSAVVTAPAYRGASNGTDRHDGDDDDDAQRRSSLSRGGIELSLAQQSQSRPFAPSATSTHHVIALPTDLAANEEEEDEEEDDGSADDLDESSRFATRLVPTGDRASDQHHEFPVQLHQNEDDDRDDDDDDDR